METKYTPGEWMQSHRKIPNDRDGFYATQVYTADGNTIATLEWYPMPKDENGAIGTYREANAKLIASAPQMFDNMQKLKSLAVKLFLLLSDDDACTAMHEYEYEKVLIETDDIIDNITL